MQRSDSALHIASLRLRCTCPTFHGGAGRALGSHQIQSILQGIAARPPSGKESLPGFSDPLLKVVSLGQAPFAVAPALCPIRTGQDHSNGSSATMKDHWQAARHQRQSQKPLNVSRQPRLALSLSPCGRLGIKVAAEVVPVLSASQAASILSHE